MASILLPVPQILQNPELPNGGANYQLLRVLHYLALPDKCELADYYLPRSAQWYGADPDRFIWAILTWTMAFRNRLLLLCGADCAGGERLPGCAGQQLPRL